MNFLSKNNILSFKAGLAVRIFLLTLMLSLTVLAETSEEAKPSRPTVEYAQNFGVMYAAQWAFYLASQSETIEKHGSFENWQEYPTQPVFDKDSFDYNILKHSLAGQYYYLFYRHQGYDEVESFGWTFLSSLAFEFTIETLTEKPSFQDIYQTPIYGTILGMGSERLSHYLLSRSSPFLQFFGYLVNPFNFLKSSSASALPNFSKEALGFVVSWRF